MDAQDKKVAAQHATRAGAQAKHAAKNSARAVKVVAEGAAEEVNDRLEEVADDVVKTAKRFSPWGETSLKGNTGQGLLAVGVALLAAGIASKKFRGVFKTRERNPILDAAAAVATPTPPPVPPVPPVA